MTSSKLLVLRPGAIGDTLLTFPALRAFRQRFPGAKITVVGNSAPLGLGVAAGFLEHHDAFGSAWVSDLFGDEPTASLRTRLEQFDLGIVWMHSAEAAGGLAVRLERAGIRHVLPLVSFPAMASRRHVADHLVDTLAPLGVSGPRPAVSLLPVAEWPHPLAPSPSEMERGNRGAPGAQISPLHFQWRGVGGEARPLVVLHPGAGGRHKRWPAERFATLADRFAELGYAIAITRGPADDDAVAALRCLVRLARPEVLDGMPLDELAKILARASLFVGNDSGITHLAALLEVPTLAIFGPFDPAYWAPIGPDVQVLDAGQSCPHRADAREGCRQCAVLSDLHLESVWEAAERALPAIPLS